MYPEEFRNPTNTDPFDKSNTITATWNGVYPKLTNGESYLFESPEPGVYIFNGLGGVGITLLFGLAEELTAGL